MDRFDIIFQKQLNEFIVDELSRLYKALGTGAVPDWAMYQRLVGRVNALEGVLAQCEDIRKQMLGGSDDGRPRPN